MFMREKRSGDRVYYQIVENRRVGGKVCQRVLMTLGRKDQLQAHGQLEQLARSICRHLGHLMVLAARPDGSADGEVKGRPGCTVAGRHIGLQLVFDRLWGETGCRAAVRACARQTRRRFDLERAVFFNVLHRLRVSGSDRSAIRWGRTRPVEGVSPTGLHHLYRAMKWLGTVLEEPAAGSGRPPRCVKDDIEERLFVSRHGSPSELDLVFFDTTTLSFPCAAGRTLGKRGHSKDRRPDDRQLVLGMALDPGGTPVCTEMWPGNTADACTLSPLRARLSERFGVRRACLVADRGMVSKQVMEELGGAGWGYILGVRMRNARAKSERLLDDPAPYQKISVERKHARDPLELEVKEVADWDSKEKVAVRFVICRSPEQAKRDAAVRKEQVCALEKKLKANPGSLVGNSGYRRLLEFADGTPRIAQHKVDAEARFDGTWILRTNTTHSAETVARKYKELWRVEQAFRTAKAVFETSPVYHRTDEAIRGHVFCSFLAILLQDELLRRTGEAQLEAEWDEILDDLDELTESVIHQDGKRMVVRSDPIGSCQEIAACVGVRLPPTVRIDPKMLSPPAAGA